MRLTGPRGWDLVRLDPGPTVSPGEDDLTALVDAVREAAIPAIPAPAEAERHSGMLEVGRRRHLRVLRPPEP